jgi:transposase
MSLTLKRSIVRYSNSFKLLVVREVEEGLGIEDVRKKYGIGGAATVQGWIERYGKLHLLNKVVRIETMDEKDRLKQLEQENKLLKMKLAETYMAKDCLEEVIRMANEEFKTDLKKNFGDQLPGSSKEPTV